MAWVTGACVADVSPLRALHLRRSARAASWRLSRDTLLARKPPQMPAEAEAAHQQNRADRVGVQDLLPFV